MSYSDQTPPSRGSTPIRDDERRRRGGAWWLWLLLGLVVLIVLLLVLSRCGGDSDSSGSAGNGAAPTSASASSSATPSTPSPTATATATASANLSAATTATPSDETSVDPSPSASVGEGGGAGATDDLTAAGTSLLPLSTSAPDGDLSTYVGTPAEATGVVVQSVPADEGFWVGTSTTDRIWVQLNGTGESAYQVTKGDQVDFTGRVVKNRAGFPASVGVSPAEGADLLTSEKAHIKVRAGAVTLSK